MTNTPNFCDQCGVKLTSHASVCSSCGAPVVAAAAKTRPVSAPCPACGRTGMTAAATIARYEAIPDKKNPTDEEAAREDRRFEITQYLAAPEKPEKISILNWIFLLLIPVVNIFSVFFSPLMKGLKIFMSLMTFIFIGFIVWYASGTFEDPFAARDRTYLVGFIWMLLYLAALLYSKQVQKKNFDARLAAYEKTMERWNHLQFCQTCEKVYFDDVREKTAPVAETSAFLESSQG